ncbi:MAG: hypothetical protein ACREBS_01535, partial [Nitrososphaerales archaeon]
LEAAKRIEVRPEQAAVVEDSLAGVEAGRRGGFALVIGVARSGDGHKLKEHGADIIVTDLKDLELDHRTPEKKTGNGAKIPTTIGTRPDGNKGESKPPSWVQASWPPYWIM